MKLLSKVLLLWAKQWLQRHSRLLSLQIQAVKLQKALDARPLLCLVHLLNSVSVSVSSVKYHNKAVVQRTELYTKKANWKESKTIYSWPSGLYQNFFFLLKKLHKCKYIWQAGKQLFKKRLVKFGAKSFTCSLNSCLSNPHSERIYIYWWGNLYPTIHWSLSVCS